MTLLTSSYSTLPEELFLKVCSELSCTEYLKLSCVCPSWNSHLTGKIWQPLLHLLLELLFHPPHLAKELFEVLSYSLMGFVENKFQSSDDWCVQEEC